MGFDVGKTNIKAVAVDADGRVLWRSAVATGAGREAAAVAKMLDGYERESGPAASVGVCAPGLASGDNRSIACLPGGTPRIEGLDWTEHLDRAGVVTVLNDAQAAAVGESWVGAARGYADAVVLTLGTGVGGGLILGGELVKGAAGRAGHLGHLTIDLDGPPGLVGAPGCLEDFVGDRTVARRSGGAYSSTCELVAAVDAGREDAADIWGRSVHALACGIVSIVNAFDPQVVVIGGGIASAGETLFEPLRAAVARVEWRPAGVGVPIVPARLGDLAGAVGAARYAANHARCTHRN